MNASRFFVSVSSVLALSAAAHAYPFHSGGPTINCPQGSLLGDGCPQNPGGAFKAVPAPNLWGPYARTSGQTWAGGDHPWTWNAPGIDYGVGTYTPKAQLLDPSVQVNLPAACSYSATGNPVGGPEVDCDNVNNLTLAHFDWFKNGTCTWLKMGLGVSGTVTIDDSNVEIGNGCVVLDAVVTGYLDAAAPTHLVVTAVLSGAIVSGDHVEGGNIDADFIVSGSGGTGTYSITGGHSGNGECKDGGACIYGAGSPQTYYVGRNPGSIIYMTAGNTSVTDVEITNSTFDGHGSIFPMAVDLISLGAMNGIAHFKNDVFLHAPGKVADVSEVGTFIVENTYAEDFCYTAAAGHCEPFIHLQAANSTQTLTRYSYDVFLQGKDGHEFPGGTALIWLGAGNALTSVINLTQVDHTITVANCVPNGPGNQGVNPGVASCRVSGNSNVAVTSASMFENQDGTFVNQTFSNNLTDNSASSYQSYLATHGYTACTNPPVWINNRNLVSGALITNWDANSVPGGGGC